MTFEERERETIRRLREELQRRTQRPDPRDRTMDRTRRRKTDRSSKNQAVPAERNLHSERNLLEGSASERNNPSERNLADQQVGGLDRTARNVPSFDRTMRTPARERNLFISPTPAMLQLDEWAEVLVEVTA